MGRLIAKMQAAGIDKDVFISPKDALEEATDESLLVLTDHSKYSITYDPELYDRLKNRLIIIDHHRRGEEFPENPMLVYIEPYASSTCELVTEMIEYQPQGGEGVLTDLEASANSKLWYTTALNLITPGTAANSCLTNIGCNVTPKRMFH